MEKKRRVLVERWGALGDITVLATILPYYLDENEDVQFVVVGPKLAPPLFEGMKGVEYVRKSKVKHFFQTQIRQKPDVYVNLCSDIWQMCVMRILFRLHGVKVAKLVRIHNLSDMRPLWKSYELTLKKVGITTSVDLDALSRQYWVPMHHDDACREIAFAPFARMEAKVWPHEYSKALVEMLSQKKDWKINLMGSRAEAALLEEWAEPYDNVVCQAGKMTFEEELKFIERQDLVVSMDSANMHFASMLGVPVVSVWGPTRPQYGYYGWRQNPDWAVYVDMDCAPCSTYGQKPCKYGHYDCIKLPANRVLEKIEQVLA